MSGVCVVKRQIHALERDPKRFVSGLQRLQIFYYFSLRQQMLKWLEISHVIVNAITMAFASKGLAILFVYFIRVYRRCDLKSRISLCARGNTQSLSRSTTLLSMIFYFILGSIKNSASNLIAIAILMLISWALILNGMDDFV